MRIAVINNYDLTQTWEEIRQGVKPDHHIYGLNYLEQWGYTIEIVPWGKDGALKTLGKWLNLLHFPLPLGDLSQQQLAIRRAGTVDLIYSPCQTEAYSLALLRKCRLLTTPLVCLAHHPFGKGRLQAIRQPFFKACFEGIDRFPALSRRVADEINTVVRNPTKSHVLAWGPQKDFYEATPGPGVGAVVAGRTGRDFVTFGRAATAAGVPAKIICLDSAVEPAFASFGNNVEKIVSPAAKPIDYLELRHHLAGARVHAIPMVSEFGLAGLTSVTDAMALGRPMILTRNRYLDIDVEDLGIGRFVDPGDEAQWIEALRWFEEHPSEAALMGAKARSIVDEGFNSHSFAEELSKILHAALGGDVGTSGVGARKQFPLPHP